MADYNAKTIKNIAVAGHGSSGKTSLCEAILYQSGIISRLGKTEDGTTICDHDAESIRRKTTTALSVAPFTLGEYKINLIDTPGMFDFSAGMDEGISAAGSVLICLSGKSGVTTGAKKAFKKATELKKAKMIFVSKLDSKSADFYKVLESLKTEFGPSVCPIVVPHYREHFVESYINLIDMKAYQYNDMGGKVEIDIPPEGHRIPGLIEAISEAVAETDEALFEKFFSGEPFTAEEISYGIKAGIKNGTLVPVLCGSALNLSGIDMLLDAIKNLLPIADEAINPTVNSETEEKLIPDEKGKTAAYIFKTVSDPFVGKLSFVKVMSGTLTSDSTLINNSKDGAEEKIGKLISVFGKKQTEIKEAAAGDICAIAKLTVSETGDTLAQKGFAAKITPPKFEEPSLFRALALEGKGDEGKIASAVAKLLEEDKTLSFEINRETKELILGGNGEQHLDCAVSRLASRYGLSVKLKEPTVAYREAITKKIKVQGKYKKQSGGHGQYGDVWIEFEPAEGEGLIFEEKVVGGAVPKGYFPAVLKGLEDSMKSGVRAGYPVVGLKATLLDGSYHPVDSSEMAFKTAASLAFKEGMLGAGAVILEPIVSLEVLVPDSVAGDLIGEINKRRGRMLGMDPEGSGMQKIYADLPESELGDFPIVLRSLSGGSASFKKGETRYEPLPTMLEDAVIAASPYRKED
ncbi:MAG: elongation factor G [Oscillospiraceae bacterium]|nr:elongation factor G [Oscillospiraceae bacterium]